MSKAETCPCGRGKVSPHDGKCGNCRTKKEQKAYTQWRVYGHTGNGKPCGNPYA